MYFKFSFFDLSMEKTLAASVEAMSAPISRLSVQSMCSAICQKAPVRKQVIMTPMVDSRTAFTATALARSQFVPKPP